MLGAGGIEIASPANQQDISMLCLSDEGLREFLVHTGLGSEGRLQSPSPVGLLVFLSAGSFVGWRLVLGATDDGGISFEAQDGLLVLAAPKPTFEDALAEAGLEESDLISGLAALSE